MRGLGKDDEAIDFLFGLAAGPKADGFLYGRDIAVAAIANVAQEMTDLLKLNALMQKVRALSSEEISPRPAAIRAAVQAIELRMTHLKR
jgi:carbohydrate-binding DOMON domain-containing protein